MPWWMGILMGEGGFRSGCENSVDLCSLLEGVSRLSLFRPDGIDPIEFSTLDEVDSLVEVVPDGRGSSDAGWGNVSLSGRRPRSTSFFFKGEELFALLFADARELEDSTLLRRISSRDSLC